MDGSGSVTMNYKYSAKMNAFSLIKDEKGYTKYGHWPDDVKPISYDYGSNTVYRGFLENMRCG